MPLTITQVDAFTSEPFGGNPAAVCLLPAPADAVWMQKVAGEMNLSETAFLVRREADGFDLRWFTPAVEVDLCGHATLASAHVLWEEGHLPPDAPAVFHTRSGRLSAVAARRLDRNGLSGGTGRAGARSRGSGRRLGCRSDPHRPEPLRLPGRIGRESDGGTARPGHAASPGTRHTRHHRHRANGRGRPSTSCRASSPPAPASTRIRSPDQRTAAWAPTGNTGSAGTP